MSSSEKIYTMPACSACGSLNLEYYVESGCIICEDCGNDGITYDSSKGAAELTIVSQDDV